MTEAANLESFFATFSFSPHAGDAGVAEALGTSVSKLFPHFLQTYSKMGIVVLLVWSRGNLHPFSESCKRLRGVSWLPAQFQSACGSGGSEEVCFCIHNQFLDKSQWRNRIIFPEAACGDERESGSKPFSLRMRGVLCESARSAFPPPVQKTFPSCHFLFPSPECHLPEKKKRGEDFRRELSCFQLLFPAE